MSGSEQLRGVWRSERPFVVAFALAAVVRVLLMVAFPPAFLMSDGPTYLGFVDDLFPSPTGRSATASTCGCCPGRPEGSSW